jgi:hypothetical protein
MDWYVGNHLIRAKQILFFLAPLSVLRLKCCQGNHNLLSKIHPRILRLSETLIRHMSQKFFRNFNFLSRNRSISLLNWLCLTQILILLKVRDHKIQALWSKLRTQTREFVKRGHRLDRKGTINQIKKTMKMTFFPFSIIFKKIKNSKRYF